MHDDTFSWPAHDLKTTECRRNVPKIILRNARPMPNHASLVDCLRSACGNDRFRKETGDERTLLAVQQAILGTSSHHFTAITFFGKLILPSNLTSVDAASLSLSPRHRFRNLTDLSGTFLPKKNWNIERTENFGRFRETSQLDLLPDIVGNAEIACTRRSTKSNCTLYDSTSIDTRKSWIHLTLGTGH